MLLVLSVLGFSLGLALFVYFFDHFMGASDTAHLAKTMAGMQDNEAVTAKKKTKQSSAAATGR